MAGCRLQSGLVGNLRSCAVAGTLLFLPAGHLWAQSDGSVSCTASARATPVRAAGVAETLPDIVIRCVPDGPLPPERRADLRLSLSLTLNASVTNTIDSGATGEMTDAVLVVNGNDCATPSSSGSTFGSCGAPRAEVQDPQLGRLLGVAALTWTSVSVPFPGSLPLGNSGRVNPTPAILRIRGVRANVSQLRLATGRNSGPPVTAALRLHSAAGVTLRNASLRLANSHTGLHLALGDTEPTAACSGDSRGAATLTLKEGFASAFEGRSETAGASAPSRLMLDFRGVPDGIEVSLPPFLACQLPTAPSPSAGGRDTLALALVNDADATGAGGFVSGGGIGRAAAVRLTEGAGSAVYEVLAADPGQVEDCHVPIQFQARDKRVSSARATVAASFAPRSASPAASAAAPSPRFARALATADVDLNLGACSTRLLFPFVTNQAGFDTGLVITHGSLQALTSAAAAQAGSCDLHFYGVGPDGQDRLLVQHTTVIAPGEQLIFTFSSGNPDRNVAGLDQFQGYLIADCGYPGARGYVFMSDGVGAIADLAMGYLAPVIPIDAEGRRAPLGEDAR